MHKVFYGAETFCAFTVRTKHFWVPWKTLHDILFCRLSFAFWRETPSGSLHHAILFHAESGPFITQKSRYFFDVAKKSWATRRPENPSGERERERERETTWREKHINETLGLWRDKSHVASQIQKEMRPLYIFKSIFIFSLRSNLWILVLNAPTYLHQAPYRNTCCMRTDDFSILQNPCGWGSHHPSTRSSG